MKKLLLSIVLLTFSFFSYGQLLDSATIYYENFDGATVNVSVETTGYSFSWKSQDQHIVNSCKTLAKSAPTSYYIGRETTAGARGAAIMGTPGFEVKTDRPHIYLSFDHIAKLMQLTNDYAKIAVEFSNDGQNFFPYTAVDIIPVPSSSGKVTSHSSTAVTYDATYGYSEMSTTAWMSAIPNNTWWRSELLDLGKLIHQSPNKKAYYRIVFVYNHGSGIVLPTNDPGWFVDNIKVLESNAEIFPPTLSWTVKHYSETPSSYRVNALNNIGPYVINADIEDADTVNLASIVFTYTVNNGPAQTLPTTIGSNSLNATRNLVKANWTIPQMCYGDTIRYRVDYADVHGNASFSERWFVPYTNMANVTSNDAGLKDFYGFPWNFFTGQLDTVSAILHNRSINAQQQVRIGWTLNGAVKPDYVWNGDMCMDFYDSIPVLGTFIPAKGWNEIVAFIKQRNNAPDNGIVANDTIKYRGYACDSAMSGAYTMGTPASDFPTLDALKFNLWYCQVKGPITINIQPGEYENFVFDTIYNGMSETNYVQFQSATGNADDVIIKDAEAATNSSSAALTLKGGQNAVQKVGYYRFNNLTFKGKESSASSRGIYFAGQGVRHIHITNCKIQIANNFTTTATTHIGIGRFQAVSTNNAVDTVVIKNNTITGGIYGIYYVGGSHATTKNVLCIENNTISSSCKGIFLSLSRPHIIDGNRVYSANTDPNSNVKFIGIHLNQLEQVESISGNLVSSSRTTYGIQLVGVAGSGGAANPILMRNNVVNVEFDVASSSGISLQSSSNLHLINNTVLTTSLNILGQTAAIETKSGAVSNIRFINNIFANQCRSTTNNNYAAYLTVLPSAFVADHNCYHSDGNNLAYFTTARATLSDWTFAVKQDTNSISRLPEFDMSPSDLLKLNDFAGFECPRHANVLEDIQGLNRSSLTFMGAYTIVVPAINLAANRLASPVDVICTSPTYQFQVALMNAGSEAINFSPTNAATVQVVFSGGINATNTFTHTSGTLNPLEEVIVNIGTHALQPNAVVNILIVAKLPGDTIAGNDTLRTSFKVDLISLNSAVGHNEYEENFSSSLTDPLWKINQVTGAGNWAVEQGTGTDPAIAPIYGTGRLFFNSKTFASSTRSKIYLPTLSLEGSVNPIMEIWYAHDQKGTNNTNEGIVVYLSTGGGEPSIALRAKETTAPADTLLKRYKGGTGAGVWTKYTFELSSWIGEGCVRLAIEARGAKSNNINIDRILLRNVLSNDCMVNDFYYYSEAPTQQELSTRVKARVTNIGAMDQSAVSVTLNVTGANTYKETISGLNIETQQEIVVYFDGKDLTNPGVNTISVSVTPDQDVTNDTLSKILTTYTNRVSYADTNTHTIAIGSNTAGYQLVNRVNVDEEIIVKAVRFYPVSELDAVGKRVIAFAADPQGDIRVISDTVTITSEMVNTWVEVPLINYALSNVSDCFYVGIRLVDPGLYIGAQLESPLRDSTFYTLNANGTYSPQIVGKAMIGAVIDKSVTQEMAILELVSPRTNCDLGTEDISIRLTNNGSQTIPEGAVFHCTINNVNHFVDTLTETLPRLATKVFTFADPALMHNNVVNYDSTFAFKIWVELIPGDRINFNDTLVKNIISLGKANLPTAEDTVSVSYYTQANLTANYPASIDPNDGELSWFANVGFEKWEMLYQGDTFTTPTIFFDTTFYVNVAPGHTEDVIVGTTLANNGTEEPFTTSSGSARGRILYRATDLNATSNQITKIALNVHSAAAANVDGNPIKIYIKNTSMASLVAETVTWADEVADALLIYDGSLVVDKTGWIDFQFPEIFEYTGDGILIMTETNCDGSCGTMPKFKYSTQNANASVQSAAVGTESVKFATPKNTRLQMKFTFSHLSCASEKVPIRLVVPDIPNYDVETVEYLYPEKGCDLDVEQTKVTIRNRLNIVIPANKVIVYAQYKNSVTGNTSTISHTIDEEFAPLEEKEVTFTTPFDFSARTTAIDWGYVVYTDIPSETLVYRANDTIKGSFKANQRDWFPDVIDTVGEYSKTFTIILDPKNNRNFYYNSADAATPFAGGTNGIASWTTPALFDTVTYWVEALNKATTNPRCITKRVRYNINVVVPDHDLKMLSLNSPGDFECGLMHENLNVSVANTKDSIIPSGTFKIDANFKGTSAGTIDRSVSHTISTPINGQATVDIPFTNTVELGSKTLNNIYDYKIVVNPVAAGMTLYRMNDTIKGTLKVPATPDAPPTHNVSVLYGDPALVAAPASAAPLNYFYFYENQNSDKPIAEGTSFTTPEIYATTEYYYSGRITDPEFDTLISLDRGNSSVTAPFDFESRTGKSQGIILYLASELGEYSGTIDTIALQVSQDSYGEIPVKLYLKNDTRTALINNTVYDFANLTHPDSATLIFDGSTDFSSADGWFRICIPGGFEYTGGNLLLLTEHDCDGESCKVLGVSPLPQFRGTAASQRVVSRTATGATDKFTASGTRINTRFFVNYTCESAIRSKITVTPTNVPARDLMMDSIETPITPKNGYTANEIIKVHFKNLGTAAASGFSVGYILDGAPAVLQSYSGSVPAGATRTHSFPAIDLSHIYFDTELKVFISWTNDGYHANDTLTTILRRPDPHHCVSRATDAAGADITFFTFAGVSTGTTPPPASAANFNYKLSNEENGSYTDYANNPGEPVREVVQGQSYPFSITNSFSTPNGVNLYKYIFIDLNGNNDLEDPEDKVFFTPSAISAPSTTKLENVITSGVVTIPSDAKLGVTRMRVIASTVSTGHPCSPYVNGETEDYAILIVEPYEYDLGIYQIFHPVGNICADANGRIRIVVKNHGKKTVQFTETEPLQFTAYITGAVTATYTKSITSGSLAAGELMDVIIDNVNFGMVGDYTMDLSMSHPIDMYLVNNKATSNATVANTNVWDLEKEPFLTNGFGANWTATQTNTNYKWTIQQGETDHYPSAGPAHDHTVGDPQFGLAEGFYAAVVPTASSVKTDNVATLTSACIDFHYEDGYPQRIGYWSHLFGYHATAEAKFYVQIGSGDNYIPVDSVINSTQTLPSDNWLKRVVDLLDIDEVARIRFVSTGFTTTPASAYKQGVIPAVDDIEKTNGYPDIGVKEIIYPNIYTSNDCVGYSDSVKMVVLIKNYGKVPVTGFDIIGRMEVGAISQRVEEHIPLTLQPGEELEYTFENSLVTTEIYLHNKFIAEVSMQFDSDYTNNRKDQISCLIDKTGVVSYSDDGVMLGQNIPNPASMSTVIPFYIPQGGSVRFTIHTIEGQLLYDHEGTYDMGDHNLELNTNQFANGLYFYTLYFNGTVLSKKMVVQKQ
ncbi:GEVED domain-containing protein [Bacteroidales bacterium OttesenSCG-928-B11]|nr:GEVED domain-containing protein [Bacteroidales bacterium OttesenSCG-928-E04]MDL2308773.1 GEVED domain-containing protein [Bacteroidales bacterium OttesenSCG-928-C03]MDL2312656.1 GEVED domain-containing protein [Bacteroidales bacterium OttesenSCG-928-B11]MDL2326093.1 GEVED domain-containing protein [Bacteroidales bacterium OttesenSCG-928-A14]